MRKRLKKAMLLLLAAVAALLTFVGCELGMTPDQAKNAYDIKATVTYYANGGKFDTGKTEKEIMYKANSRPLNIGVDAMPSGTITLTNGNRVFEGWYYVALDEETGEPIVDEKGVCTLDMERGAVDFSTALLQEGDDWYLGAKWRENAKVRVRLDCDGELTDKAGNVFDPLDNKDIKVSEYVSTNENKTELKVTESPIELADDSEYQFVGYYDQEGTPILDELVKGDEQIDDVIVYARYVSKEWTLVKSANEVSRMFADLGKANKKFYITRNIDMKEETCRISNRPKLAATVQGNGMTISNMTIKQTSISGKFSLFGTVNSTANISNLTFENLTLDYGLKSAADVYFVFTEYEEGATVENVTLSGTMKVGGRVPTNLVSDYTKCLFGGFETDAAYTAAYPNGFKVVGNPADFITK